MERRDFLVKSSLLTIGAGMGLMACKETVAPVVVPEGERIRIGIVGIGDRGSTIVKVLSKLPQFKIIAVCDVLDFRLEKALGKINEKAIGYTDYKKMLENKDLEAIVVSVPLHEHYRIVMDALDCDIHIMCEKALAHTIEQSREIKIKANDNPKLFQIAYQYQLNPTFNVIKDIIHKGYLGKVMRIDAKWHRNSNWLRPVPSPELERAINWRMYKEYSGGLMAELGSHHLNMIDNIIGEHPVKVVGTGGVDYWKDGREVCDNVFAVYDYPGGVKASFSSILSNKFEDQTIKFYGDKGTIVVNRMKDALLYSEDVDNAGWGEDIDAVSGASIKIINRDKDKRRTIDLPKDAVQKAVFESDYEQATYLLYKNFALAIRGEEELELGLKDGYQSAISVHMANRAIRGESIEHWLPEYDV